MYSSSAKLFYAAKYGTLEFEAAGVECVVVGVAQIVFSSAIPMWEA